MTNHDLLDAIGDARGTYLWHAQQHRAGTAAPKAKTIPLRRLWLVAAILAIMLLLVGCVAYVLSLQEMQLAQSHHTEHLGFDAEGNPIAGETTTHDILSLQGYAGSNAYLAMQEWYHYQEEYDPDHEILLASEDQAASIPAAYGNYGCYTQEMVQKLEQIAEKYRMKLLSPPVLFQFYETHILTEALDFESVCRPEAQVEVQYLSGYFYPEGTFDVPVEITPGGEDFLWKHPVSASIRYSLTGFFDPAVSSVGDADSYDQWNHTTADGTQVLLAVNETDAIIIAELERAFLTIRLDIGSTGNTLSKEAIQQIADVFDYQMDPRSADMEEVERLLAASAAKLEAEKADAAAQKEALYASGYQAVAEDALTSCNYPEKLAYALCDLNGDGVEEFILGDIDGYCFDIVSSKAGATYQYCKLPLPLQKLYPCEGNILKFWLKMEGVEQVVFLRATDSGAEFVTNLSYSPENRSWYLHTSLEPWKDAPSRQLSQEEAQKIIGSYTPTELSFTPLSEFLNPIDSYEFFVTGLLTNTPEAERYRYCKRDVSGDGQRELILDTGDYLGIYTIFAGEVRSLTPTAVDYLCEGNVLESHSAFDGWIVHSYELADGTSIRPLHHITYDPNTRQWTRSDGSRSGEETVITEAEAQSIIGSYTRIQLDMKPLAEYPLNQPG